MHLEPNSPEFLLHQQTVALAYATGIEAPNSTLYTVCRQAILDGEGTPERVREIWEEWDEALLTDVGEGEG
jgi:hypothetical protein